LENHASNGAGILNNGFLELRNSIFNGNVSGNAGGGIYSGDSIWIFNSNLVNNTSGSGGGLYVYANSYALLDSSELSGNHAIGGGGGLCCGKESVVCINNVKINNNLSNNTAGGIFSATSGLHIKKSDITYNHADNSGGGIYCDDEAFPQFDSTDRCNLFLNWAGIAKDIFTKDGMVNVILDTFTVLYPTDYFVNNRDDFTFDILAGKVEQAYADLYVSTVGSDTNSGFSSDNPLKTIDRAMMILRSDSINQHTIHLADGIYSGSSNGEKFPVQLSDYCSLDGETRDGTILDAEDSSHVLNLYYDHIPEIKNLTLTGGSGTSGGGLSAIHSDFNLFNVKIMDNTSNYQGGGVSLRSGSIAELNHVVFENNEGSSGGGIEVSYSSAQLKNIDFIHNHATDGGGIYISHPDTLTMDYIYCYSNTAENYGGAIYARNSELILADAVFDSNQAYRGGGFCLESSSMNAKNTLFVRNTAADGYGGAGTIYNYGAPPDAEVNLFNATCTQNAPPVFHIYGGKVNLTNSILWDNNNPIQIYYFVDYSASDTLRIANSDIQNAQSGIFKSGGAVLDWNAGNINEDPQFSMGDEYPFSLDAGSPCIDAGTPDTTGLLLPYNDLIGNVRVWDGDEDGISIIDMGPYEYGAAVTVDDDSFPEAGKKILFTLYPNPATDYLTIHCSDHSGDISMKLMNSLGQIVEVITLPANLNMANIQLSHLGPGIYWAQFSDEKGISSIEKLIISK
jgi:predicted outer membrane repeat protein